MAKRQNSQPLSGQLVSYIPNSYAERTSRPIYALMYLLGFLVFYEIGSLMVQPETLWQSLAEPQMRVVAFVWVQNILEYLGFSDRMTWVAAPLVVVVILLALQFTSKKSWRVNYGDFVPMTLECVGLSIPLIVLSLMLNRATEPGAAFMTDNPVAQHRLFVDIVTGIGAGIYEELVFRLVLIGLLMLFFQDLCGLASKQSIVLSVVISAILFSIHHHFFFANGHFYKGDTFTIGKFVFRAMAGVYFAILYAVRGFGITAGAHAFYNIMAAFLRTLFFVIEPE